MKLKALVQLRPTEKLKESLEKRPEVDKALGDAFTKTTKVPRKLRDSLQRVLSAALSGF